MIRVVKEIIVSAPVDVVFEYVANFENNVLWIVSVTEIFDLTPPEPGVGQSYSWTYSLAGIPFKGNSVVTEFEPNKRLVYETMGGINSTWTYLLTAENGKTHFQLQVDYIMPLRALSKLAEPFLRRMNERETDLSLQNLKELIEQTERIAVPT